MINFELIFFLMKKCNLFIYFLSPCEYLIFPVPFLSPVVRFIVSYQRPADNALQWENTYNLSTGTYKQEEFQTSLSYTVKPSLNKPKASDIAQC